VETKESPLSKVAVLMPQVTPVIGAQQVEVTFEAQITNAYKGLRHGLLNRVFELLGVLYQPRPEPIVHKQKTAIPLLAPVPPS
jgi:hypothetical protein